MRRLRARGPVATRSHGEASRVAPAASAHLHDLASAPSTATSRCGSRADRVPRPAPLGRRGPGDRGGRRAGLPRHPGCRLRGSLPRQRRGHRRRRVRRAGLGARAPAAPPRAVGRRPTALLKDTGHALTYVQRFPGFVCRIDGAARRRPVREHPARRRLLGPVVVRREDGGVELLLARRGLAHDPGGRVRRHGLGRLHRHRPAAGRPGAPPDTDAHPHADADADEEAVADARPRRPPRARRPRPALRRARPSPRPLRAGRRSRSPRHSPSPSETTSAPTSEAPADEQTEAAGVVEDPVDPSDTTGAGDDDGGLPVWVAPVVVVVLLGAAGGVAVARRRQQP